MWPLHLCPADLRELYSSIAFDPIYRDMLTFAIFARGLAWLTRPDGSKRNWRS
jgi:hypothetical protein